MTDKKKTYNLAGFTIGQKTRILQLIAARDAEWYEQVQVEREEKEYFHRAAENAIRSKRRALHRRSEQRKDLITAALLLIGIALFFYFSTLAVHELILWASQ